MFAYLIYQNPCHWEKIRKVWSSNNLGYINEYYTDKIH